MNTVTIVEKADPAPSEEFVLQEALKWASVGVGIISTYLYGMEKMKRYGEIVAKTDNEPIMPELGIMKTFTEKIRYFAYAVQGMSFAIMAVNFFGPVYQAMIQGKDVKLFGSFITIPSNNKILRVFVFYVLLPVVLISTLLGIGFNFKKVSNAYDNWQKQLSYVTNGVECFWGILQLGLYIGNPESYKDKKLLAFGSIATSLSAFVEMYGFDRLLYSAEPFAGSVYWGVYGTRTAIQQGAVVGLITS